MNVWHQACSFCKFCSFVISVLLNTTNQKKKINKKESIILNCVQPKGHRIDFQRCEKAYAGF